MRILTVIGNRPQFVKAAAVSRRLRERHEEVLVHTGQHYDDELSRVFFERARLPRARPPAGHPGGSNADADGAHARTRSEPRARRARAPTSCSSTATPTRPWPARWRRAQARIPLAHVEAGMRSFDRAMPEERNRVLADHLASCCSAPPQTAVDNLRARGRRRDVELVGDVMADVSLVVPRAPRTQRRARALGLSRGDYLLVDGPPGGQRRRPGAAGALVEILARLPRPVVLPGASAHPGAARGGRPARARSSRRRPASRAAARLPRLPGLLRGARGRADRLGRRPEGGLPRRGAAA